MTQGTGSNVVRRQLGVKLRRLREEAGKTHGEIELAGIASVTKMWRIESGKVAVKAGDIWALSRLYGLSNDVTDALVLLSNGTRTGGWWEEYKPAVPEWLGLYAGLEAGATSIHAYHPELVLGLLQTHDYAHAVITAEGQYGEDVVERRTEFRLQRQKAVLHKVGRGPIRVILGATALYLVIGSGEVMAAQHEHLCKLNAEELVEVRIMPWSAGAYPRMKGAFTILEFPEPEDPRTVHVDTHFGGRYIEAPQEVKRYQGIFQLLHTRSVPIQEYTRE